MHSVSLQLTKFVNMPQGSETFGYRIYDDYGQSYDNTHECLIEDDLELLGNVMDSGDETATAILDFLLENAKGITINDNWYEWDEIRHLWGD